MVVVVVLASCYSSCKFQIATLKWFMCKQVRQGVGWSGWGLFYHVALNLDRLGHDCLFDPVSPFQFYSINSHEAIQWSLQQKSHVQGATLLCVSKLFPKYHSPIFFSFSSFYYYFLRLLFNTCIDRRVCASERWDTRTTAMCVKIALLYKRTIFCSLNSLSLFCFCFFPFSFPFRVAQFAT